MAEASKQPDTHYNQLPNGSVNNFNNSSKAHQTINNPMLNTPTEQKTAKKTPKKIGLKIFILFAAVILLVAAALIAIYLNMEPHDTQVSESDHISSSDKQDELQSFIIKTVSGTDFVDISNHIYVDKDNSIYVELSDLKSYLGLDSSDNLLYETLYLDVYDNEYDCRINQENCLAKYMGAEKLNKRYKFLLDVDYVLEEDFKFKTDTTYFFRFYTDSINDVSLKYELDLV